MFSLGFGQSTPPRQTTGFGAAAETPATPPQGGFGSGFAGGFGQLTPQTPQPGASPGSAPAAAPPAATPAAGAQDDVRAQFMKPQWGFGEIPEFLPPPELCC